MGTEKDKITEAPGHDQNVLSILPFAKVGIPELELFLIYNAFNDLIKDNRLFLALKDIEIDTLEKFVAYCYDPDNIIVFVVDNMGSIYGMGWINNHGRPFVGYAHICIARHEKAKPRIAEIGEMLVNYAFSMRYNGLPIYKVMISKSNKKQAHVRKFVSKLGFTPVGVIPFTSDTDTDAFYAYKVNPASEHERDWSDYRPAAVSQETSQ